MDHLIDFKGEEKMEKTYSVTMTSSVMLELFERTKRIAQFPSTVLIEGETGVGKEVFATLLHQNSPRTDRPFIKINCGAIPETLLESELFGYERGAFTGAKNEGSPGLFELADKGTLLLDEVGELSPSMQVKLLRVLQEREIRRVGGSWSKTIDVRVIASTNCDLKQLVNEHVFREDLYYRLNVARLYIPPLREHREDIGPLLDYYLDKICNEFQITRFFEDEARSLLLNHHYPGNIRELRNLIEGLCVTSEAEIISSNSVKVFLHSQRETNRFETHSLQDRLDQLEKTIILEALQSEVSIRKAAKLLDISHATLLRKMKKYKIQAPERLLEEKH